jgi:hypothetical protein
MEGFMTRLDEAIDAQHAVTGPEALEPDDEFQWEQTLRESDQRGEKYAEVLEKYRQHPDRERLVAREMGWTWIEDTLDANARGVYDEERAHVEAELESMVEPEPDPSTEGIDWIRDENGRVMHPLAHSASESALALYRLCEERGLLGDQLDEDLDDLLFNTQRLGVKLGGALDNLSSEVPFEPGFVVALLKRALSYFEAALAAHAGVREKSLLEPEVLDKVRRDLFAIRQEMLALMERFRDEHERLI